MEPLYDFGCCDLAGLPPNNHSVELRGRVKRLPSVVLTLLLGDGDTLPLALEDILPLQLGYCAEDGQHKLAVGCYGIGVLLLEDELHSQAISLSTSSSRSF